MGQKSRRLAGVPGLFLRSAAQRAGSPGLVDARRSASRRVTRFLHARRRCTSPGGAGFCGAMQQGGRVARLLRRGRTPAGAGCQKRPPTTMPASWVSHGATAVITGSVVFCADRALDEGVMRLELALNDAARVRGRRDQAGAARRQCCGERASLGCLRVGENCQPDPDSDRRQAEAAHQQAGPERQRERPSLPPSSGRPPGRRALLSTRRCAHRPAPFLCRRRPFLL